MSTVCRGGFDDFDARCDARGEHPHIDSSGRLHFYCTRHYRMVKTHEAFKRIVVEDPVQQQESETVA